MFERAPEITLTPRKADPAIMDQLRFYSNLIKYYIEAAWLSGLPGLLRLSGLLELLGWSASAAWAAWILWAAWAA